MQHQTELGAVIRSLRKSNGLKQTELSELLGVHHSSISFWESGTYYPSAKHMRALSRLFSVDLRKQKAKLEAAAATKPVEVKPVEPKKQRINRVWIELPVPEDADHAKEIADQANAMMRKLGNTQGYAFSWEDGDGWYWGSPMGWSKLHDNGTWFNLNYLSE